MDTVKKDRAFGPAIATYCVMIVYYLFLMYQAIMKTGMYRYIWWYPSYYSDIDLVYIVTVAEGAVCALAVIAFLIITIVKKRQSAIGMALFFILCIIATILRSISMGKGGMYTIIALLFMIFYILAMVFILIGYSKEKRGLEITSIVFLALIVPSALFQIFVYRIYGIYGLINGVLELAIVSLILVQAILKLKKKEPRAYQTYNYGQFGAVQSPYSPAPAPYSQPTYTPNNYSQPSYSPAPYSQPTYTPPYSPSPAYNAPQNNSLNGAMVSDADASTAKTITMYKRLLDEGAITQEEYDAKKRQLLGL